MSQMIIDTGKSSVLDNGAMSMRVMFSNEKYVIVDIDAASYVQIETEESAIRREQVFSGYLKNYVFDMVGER